MAQCIFCDIARGGLPATIAFQDREVVAFNDIQPKAPVHILIVPREHIQSIAHLEANHNEVIAKLIYAAKHIATEQGLHGYKLVFNVGREGGQAVDHLHLHLLGGWKSDEERARGFIIDRIHQPDA